MGEAPSQTSSATIELTADVKLSNVDEYQLIELIWMPRYGKLEQRKWSEDRKGYEIEKSYFTPDKFRESARFRIFVTNFDAALNDSTTKSSAELDGKQIIRRFPNVSTDFPVWIRWKPSRKEVCTSEGKLSLSGFGIEVEPLAIPYRSIFVVVLDCHFHSVPSLPTIELPLDQRRNDVGTFFHTYVGEMKANQQSTDRRTFLGYTKPLAVKLKSDSPLSFGDTLLFGPRFSDATTGSFKVVLEFATQELEHSFDVPDKGRQDNLRNSTVTYTKTLGPVLERATFIHVLWIPARRCLWILRSMGFYSKFKEGPKTYENLELCLRSSGWYSFIIDPVEIPLDFKRARIELTISSYHSIQQPTTLLSAPSAGTPRYPRVSLPNHPQIPDTYSGSPSVNSLSNPTSSIKTTTPSPVPRRATPVTTAASSTRLVRKDAGVRMDDEVRREESLTARSETPAVEGHKQEGRIKFEDVRAEGEDCGNAQTEGEKSYEDVPSNSAGLLRVGAEQDCGKEEQHQVEVAISRQLVDKKVEQEGSRADGIVHPAAGEFAGKGDGNNEDAPREEDDGVGERADGEIGDYGQSEIDPGCLETVECAREKDLAKEEVLETKVGMVEGQADCKDEKVEEAAQPVGSLLEENESGLGGESQGEGTTIVKFDTPVENNDEEMMGEVELDADDQQRLESDSEVATKLDVEEEQEAQALVETAVEKDLLPLPNADTSGATKEFVGTTCLMEVGTVITPSSPVVCDNPTAETFTAAEVSQPSTKIEPEENRNLLKEISPQGSPCIEALDPNALLKGGQIHKEAPLFLPETETTPSTVGFCSVTLPCIGYDEARVWGASTTETTSAVESTGGSPVLDLEEFGYILNFSPPGKIEPLALPSHGSVFRESEGARSHDSKDGSERVVDLELESSEDEFYDAEEGLDQE